MVSTYVHCLAGSHVSLHACFVPRHEAFVVNRKDPEHTGPTWLITLTLLLPLGRTQTQSASSLKITACEARGVCVWGGGVVKVATPGWKCFSYASHPSPGTASLSVFLWFVFVLFQFIFEFLRILIFVFQQLQQSSIVGFFSLQQDFFLIFFLKKGGA